MRSFGKWSAGAVGVMATVLVGSNLASAASTDGEQDVIHTTTGAAIFSYKPLETFPQVVPNLANNDYVALQANERGRIAELKAANPHLKVYFYANSSAVSRTPDDEYQSSVVSLAQYREHEADWALKRNGADFLWDNYPDLLPTNLGDSEYQKASVDYLKAEFERGGWDGVMFDDVNFDDSGHGHKAGDDPTNFTGTDLNHDGRVDREEATTSFLNAVGPQVKALGKDVVANVQQSWGLTNANDFATLRVWSRDVSGVLMEHSPIEGDGQAGQTPGNLYDGGDDWRWKAQETAVIQQAGAGIFPMTYLSTADDAAARYARAFFLMAWDGSSRSANWMGMAPEQLTYADPTGGLDIGTPGGPATEPVTGVYTRVFSKSRLWVNTTKEPVTVQTYWNGTVTIPSHGVFVD